MGAPLDTNHAGTRAAVDAAGAAYLRGETVDMVALADELEVGRATLYRWVGSREQLLLAVLAELTQRTFAAARRHATGTGADLVIDACARFMQGLIAAEPLKIFTDREPLLFIRLATAPGPIEQAAASGIEQLLREQADSGAMHLAAPADVLAVAIVRVCDSHVYSHVIGHAPPDVETAVTLIKLLLRE